MWFIWKNTGNFFLSWIMWYGEPWRRGRYYTTRGMHYGERVFCTLITLMGLTLITAGIIASNGIVLLVIFGVIEFIEICLLIGRGLFVFLTYREASKNNLPVPADFWKDDLDWERAEW